MNSRVVMYYYIVVIIYFMSVQITCCDNTNKDEDIFIPTHEWKTIKEGQILPKGLHIRINLETGLKEAKLVDEDTHLKSRSSLIVVHDDNNIESNNREKNGIKFDPDELKRKLYKIKDDGINDEDVKKKFRSYEELKKDMQELNLEPKTDGEIMDQLVDEYQKELKKKEVVEDTLLRIITDLEYLAHQYDNALNFLKYDGFRKIIFKNLNSTNNLIKEESLKLFSSLVQNNPQVKVHALEAGSIPVLLRVLLNLDSSEEVKLRAITALGCLLRMFPYAQINFIENGGLALFSDLFELDYTKVNVKIVTIINDFLLERQKDVEHFKSFKKVDLGEILVKLKWCEHFTDLLNILLYTTPDDSDAIEKVLIAMHSMPNECNEYYDRVVIENLQEQYKDLADSENDYFENLTELCEMLLAKLGNSNKIKTEL